MWKAVLITGGLLLLAASRLFAKSNASTLVKYYEESNKPKLQAYWDQYGKVWTIGYGCTSYENGAKVKQGDTITALRAEQLHNYFIDQSRKSVLRLVKVTISENKIQALTSFVYNLGETKFANSTMLKLINQKRFIEAANEFEKWDNAGGVINVPGLVKRRLAEKKLFLS